VGDRHEALITAGIEQIIHDGLCGYGIEAVGKLIDPLAEADSLECGTHVVVRRVTITDSDVAGDRASAEERSIASGAPKTSSTKRE
jgi:hypothetical protein